MLEHVVRSNSELIKRMKAEGHLICNHTANHPNLANAPKEKIAAELQQLEDAVTAVTGECCAPYFRPTEGSFSRAMLETVQELGYQTVFWSFAYADWDNQHQPAPRAALQKILANMHNGAVLLLHPTSETNAIILKELIDTLKNQGYRFGTLEELCKGR